MPDPIVNSLDNKDPNATPDPNTNPTPPSVSVPAEEWGAMKARLDAFERNAYNPQNVQPAQPAAPTGPTVSDQIKEIGGQIDALDAQIDAATNEGKPISKLLRERDALNARSLRLQIKSEDIDPTISAGIQTIDQLSAEVTKGKMPYLHLVKDDFNATINSLPPEQRMNPEVRATAYQIACGKNMDAIIEAKQEEMLRKGNEHQTDDPGSNNGRNTPTKKGGVPRPDEVLSKGAMDAMTSVGKDADTYYRGMGYKGGWEEYWTKHYKEEE